jgi:type I restriction-modification system DNA methylase subunit
MSRLESKKAAGYFPTPQGVVARIVNHLIPPRSGDFRWLDPCCGAPRSACL